MAHARFSSLLVIALLQLSQTEISSTLPESWYAANVINDGAYSPKPISEIFTTQPSLFSTTNPIVVLSSSPTPSPIVSPASTQNFSTSTSTQSTTFSTTEKPITEVSVVPLPTEQPVQPQSADPVPSQAPSLTTIVFESTRLPQPPQPPQPPQLPELSVFQQPPAPPSPPPILSTPQQIQIQTASQGNPPQSQVANNLPPNYFLLYQQAPQTIQNYPSGPPLIFADPTSSQAPTASTFSSLPAVTSTTPLPIVTSTTPLPIVTSTSLPPRVTPTTLPASSVSTAAPCANSVTKTVAPQANLPSFKIRLVAPSGSVTNVRFNQNPTTTTRRPTTTRTRKRSRNNYDGCVSGCTGVKVPICASPLGVSPIDPNTLKGFPSVCHMACHNSFRKNLYEKVMDGKCGRLRNRIRPLNSNSKLKKEDLNKATYTIVQGGPAVVEFSPLIS